MRRNTQIVARAPAPQRDPLRQVIDAEYEIIHPKPRERPSPVWLFVAAFVLFSGLLWGAWIGLMLLGYLLDT